MGKIQQSLPRGVNIRTHATSQTIFICFTYRGVTCREPLSGVPVTPANIRYAANLLGEIRVKIDRGTFNYADHFPKSSKVKIFGAVSSTTNILNYLNKYLQNCEKRGLSPSTLNGYKKCCNALKSIHSILVTDLTPAIVKNWLVSGETSTKTTRNIMSFLRASIDEAVTDGLLQVNPVSQVSVGRYKGVEPASEISSREVDPFTPAEVAAILTTAGNAQWVNLFQFAFETGMRSSELCALRWSDLDLVGNTVSVSSAKVVGIMKGTKTKAGKRTIELSNEALAAVQDQKRFTFLHSEFVFHDPKTESPWAGADAIRKKAWVPVLKKSGVRYRHPYQTRHTFATRHISQGKNLFWLAQQMGHKGPEMLFRHYGTYLAEYDNRTSNYTHTARDLKISE